MFRLKSFRVIAVALALFCLVGCSLNAREYHNIKVVNNTDETMFIEVWLKDIGWYIRPGHVHEFLIGDGKTLELWTSLGVVYTEELYGDTTVELNPTSFWVGEQEYKYWTDVI